MASTVRSAISDVLAESCLDVDSPRITQYKAIASELFQRVGESEEYKDAFAKFSTELTTRLEGIYMPIMFTLSASFN